MREIWILSFSPSWKSIVNSLSHKSLAIPLVAAMFPAVRDASDVVSISCVSPADAMS